MEQKNKSAISITEEAAESGESVKLPEDQDEVMSFIQNDAEELKPEGLKMDIAKWKILLRQVLRGENALFTGPSGCGKTVAAMSAVQALNREFFYFNLGSTQDPRTTLIGTREVDEGSTYFSPSLFIKAIQTEGAVILLDELSRAHPEAVNILLTPLDPKQRYIRLDESQDSETIEVADDVAFVGTANIGSEYTAARTIDHALWDRFLPIEMDPLEKEQEKELILETYPGLHDQIADVLAEIAEMIRERARGDDPQIEKIISTRQNLRVAGMIRDGLALSEAAKAGYYPNYSPKGGLDSPRSEVKKIVQKHIDDGSDDQLFSNQEIKQAPRKNN